MTGANERPKKVARATNKEEECTCILFIPSWFEERRGLFRKCLFYIYSIFSFSSISCLSSAKGHLIGDDGHGTRHIKSTTTCSVRISRHDDIPMTIAIKSGSSCDVTQTSPYSNVAKAVELIEQSILAFLADRDTEKKMLYDLAVKAKVTKPNNFNSFKLLFTQERGVVQRKYDGVKKWSRVLGLPYNWLAKAGK